MNRANTLIILILNNSCVKNLNKHNSYICYENIQDPTLMSYKHILLLYNSECIYENDGYTNGRL